MVPARILKHPIHGQSEGSWQVQWLREALGTGIGSTKRFDPWINDDSENLCSTVVISRCSQVMEQTI